MSKNRFVYLDWLAIIALMILPGVSLSKDVVVNLMMDIDSPASPTPEQMNMVSSSIVNLTNPIDSRGLDSTFFVTGDTASSDRLEITSIGSKANHELALHGIATGEKLGSLSYSEQEALLNKAKGFIDACHICGGRIVAINGFRPQSFDQNNDTFKVLESLGFTYDAGFEVGTLYLPGHKNDTWPYLIKGYNLYAVPVSSHYSSGVWVNLSDRYAKEEMGISGTKWYDLLMAKLDEAAINGDPVVVIFSNQITGMDADYLKAYSKFIDYAHSKKATFVNTSELVNMTKFGKRASISSGVASETANAGKSGCTECATLKNASKNITFQNNTASKEIAVNIVPNFKD